MTKSLMWLASYPKSGNTWMRAFLANYIFNLPQPVPINQLSRLGIGDANTLAHRRSARGPFNPSDPRETVRVRQMMLDTIDANGADLNLIKTHNQNTRAFGVDLVPRHQTKGAIYVIRDPRDMAISYASHHGMSLEETVHRLGHPENATAGNENTVHQFLGTWSDHVRSWTRARGFPVRTVRYEDLLSDPEPVFRKIVEFLKLGFDDTRLKKAIDFSSFDKLKAQEQKTGFVENSDKQDVFFRSGKSGQWQDILTPEQVQKIETDHERVMRRYGYLD